MVLLTTFAPLLGFLTLIFAGRCLGRPYSAPFVASALMVVSFLGALALAWTAFFDGMVQTTLRKIWCASHLFEALWSLEVDALVAAMLLLVITVSTLVHLYSGSYMAEDPHLPRFMSYLSLFTFFMLLLITSNNLIGLFLGWEGVGLCSYLLISFWYTRLQANKSAIKAMVVNRVSDLTFTVGIAIAFYTFQSVDFGLLFAAAPYVASHQLHFLLGDCSVVTLITTLLFLGAMGKSAQFLLHTWLPSAMEGPTPVSALIHAATMVTAGVFLLIRCSALFELSAPTLTFVAVVGACTTFFSATSGLVQYDLKRVIAFSTCSQLGYMIFACGLSQYSLSLFHLVNHGFFKALLFLSAGAVIHAVSNEQDMRKLGGLIRLLPFTYMAMLIGSLALMGTPFLTGFYSKDIILEFAAGDTLWKSQVTYLLGLLTALLTAIYSVRLLYLTFLGPSRLALPVLKRVHEGPALLCAPLVALAIGSIAWGFIAKELFIGLGTDVWNGIVSHTPGLLHAQLEGELLSPLIRLIPLFGSFLAIGLVIRFRGQWVLPRALVRFLGYTWNFDTIYNGLINRPILRAAYTAPFQLIDKGLLEWSGPTGLERLGFRFGRSVARQQTGRVFQYALLMLPLLWFVSFLFLFLTSK